MENKNLQPCYSCLSKAEYVEHEGTIHVLCSKCEMHYAARTEAEAFKSWNEAAGYQRLFMAAMHPGILQISETID